MGATDPAEPSLSRNDDVALFPTYITLSIIDVVSVPDPADELRRLYPPILTTAHVAEMMHCTIGDVRDKVHRGELEALRWGQQFRFFREEVLSSMTRFQAGDPAPADENIRFDGLPTDGHG